MTVQVKPPPDALIVIEPAAFVMLTPVPAVSVEATGATPVDPIIT
jgi:hypothetical protein